MSDEAVMLIAKGCEYYEEIKSLGAKCPANNIKIFDLTRETNEPPVVIINDGEINVQKAPLLIIDGEACSPECLPMLLLDGELCLIEKVTDKKIVWSIDGNELVNTEFPPCKAVITKTSAPDSVKKGPWATPPKGMSLEGEHYKIQRYTKEVLLNTAEWLVKKGKIKRTDCPVEKGSNYEWYFINVDPIHQNGKDFYSPKKLSNGLYLETGYSAEMCIEMAYRLLEKCGYSKKVLNVFLKSSLHPK